jgi:glycosyltransferase involved in cell wall biosynthesis
MRICLFTSTFLPKIGGHEVAMDELARHLTAIGHEVVVLAQTASRWRSTQELTRPYRIEWFSKPLSQKWAIGKFRRVLARLYRQWRFDVIHTFSSYPTGFAALELSSTQRVPLIITSQGGDLAEGSRYEKRPLVMSRIRQTLRDANAVTNISRYMRQRALALQPACLPRLYDIPNGVDVASMRAAAIDPAIRPFPSLEKGSFILFLGRFHPRKGIDVLIRAFGKTPSGRFRLVIAGRGRDEQTLKALAAENPHRDKIDFVGPVAGAAKQWLLQNAAFVAAPTRTWEGMPVVVLESLACGQPVIGTRVGGIVDLIIDDQNGLLVEPEDADQLASAMSRLMNDPAQRDRLSRGAAESITRYDWSVVGKQYVQLYEQLLAKRKNAEASAV